MTTPPHAHLITLFEHAVRAVNPVRLVQEHVQKTKKGWQILVDGRVIDLPVVGQIYVVGGGKGAGLLARGLTEVLGEQLAAGVVVVPVGQGGSSDRITLTEGGHPLPTVGSLQGTGQIWEILQKTEKQDLVFFCLTGGASSLLIRPAVGISLEDKITVNHLLLTCGADIAEMNTLRKHLSQIKGGGMARAAFPATLASLIISDVIGDDLGTIGSGPTTPDPTSFAQAWGIVEQYRLAGALPKSVLQHLKDGIEGRIPETPQLGDPIFTRVYNLLIGHNRLALDAAVETAQTLGYTPRVVNTQLQGDTGEAARDFAQALRKASESEERPLCLLAGGETTVRVTGLGKGGRNQEFALVVACELAGRERWRLLSAGTDGIDGPTDAAGAFVDGTTVGRARSKGLDPLAFLADNNSYYFFSALGDLFCPGPTGTNVMDVKIALLQP